MLEQQIVEATSSLNVSKNGLQKLRMMGFLRIDPLSPRPLWLDCPAGEATQGELQGEQGRSQEFHLGEYKF